MKVLLLLLLVFLLCPICWPAALGIFLVFIVFWLILLPFQILGLTLGLIFKIVGAILLLPLKLLGL
jgi:hypothetical protein